jgi:DNA-binding protein Fis
MDVEMDSTFKDKWLDDDVRKALEKYHKKFRSGKEVSSEVLEEYEVLLRDVLESLVGN